MIALPLRLPLCFHMARLAVPNQILVPVRFLRACEEGKWPNVVHWEAVADGNTAACTVPLLLLHHGRPRLRPALPTICGRAANPQGRRRTGHMLAPMRRFAFQRAKFTGVAAAQTPRLLAERLAASFALEHERR